MNSLDLLKHSQKKACPCLLVFTANIKTKTLREAMNIEQAFRYAGREIGIQNRDMKYTIKKLKVVK